MSLFRTGLIKVFQNVRPSSNVQNLLYPCYGNTVIQTCGYAARRGTRERKAKIYKANKLKNEAKKAQKLLEYIQRRKKQALKEEFLAQQLEASKPDPVDNVYFIDMFKIRQFSFSEAVNAHRETHHPSFYNMPNAFLNAYIELDLSTDKKTKFQEKYTGLVPIEHRFHHGEFRSILAFCATSDQVNAVLEAGASLAGGSDVIKSIKRGKTMLPDFQYVIAHPNIIGELAAIKGLLRKYFPTLENGMLTVDMVKLIEDIKTGIRYHMEKSDSAPEHGWVDTKIGNLDMDIDKLEENFTLLLKNVKSKAPRRTKNPGPYITKCFLTSAPSSERFMIPFEHYIAEAEEEVESDDEEEELDAKELKKKKKQLWKERMEGKGLNLDKLVAEREQRKAMEEEE